jgi:hypothetical protein
VPRAFDSGHDSDAASRRVGDDVAVVSFAVEATSAAADLCSRADVGEVGPFVDVNPPALVVGQV